MRIKLESDIHLNIYEYYNEETYKVDLKDIDVYIIAGDLCEAHKSNLFLLNLCEQYPDCKIIEIAGNHTYYKGNIQEVNRDKRKLSEAIENYFFLENSHIEIQGINFIGACFWTDLNNGDRDVINEVWLGMNDYYNIRYLGKKLSPFDTINMHRTSKKCIKEMLECSTSEINIVITHHLPFYNVIFDDIIHYAYGSKLDSWLNSLKVVPNYWFSGHTHKYHNFSKKFTNGSIQFINNPLGYPSEKKTGYDKDFILEIKTDETK